MPGIQAALCPLVNQVMIQFIDDRKVFLHRYSVLIVKKARSQKRPGFLFFARYRSTKNKGRYVMKFLLAVLAVHFVVELFSSKKKINENEVKVPNDIVRHPAEFELRY